MAHRVAVAARRRERKIDPRLRRRISELGRTLLYLNGPEEIKVDKQPLGSDDPALLVAELEDTADGCDWLLQRWSEYGNLLHRRTRWEEPVLIRFLRLMGKRLVEAVFDPEINLIFLAWDVIEPGYARKEWESYSDERSILDPAYTHRLKWREIAPRPKDPEEAWDVLSTIFKEYVTRLKELLAENETNEAMLKDDPTWMDRAAMDCSPAFERHRRYQSARTRELHKTLELLNKMRNSESQMAEGETTVASEDREAEGTNTLENAPIEAKIDSAQLIDAQKVEPDSGHRAAHDRSQNGAVPVVHGEQIAPGGATQRCGSRDAIREPRRINQSVQCQPQPTGERRGGSFLGNDSGKVTPLPAG